MTPKYNWKTANSERMNQKQPKDQIKDCFFD